MQEWYHRAGKNVFQLKAEMLPMKAGRLGKAVNYLNYLPSIGMFILK